MFTIINDYEEIENNTVLRAFHNLVLCQFNHNEFNLFLTSINQITNTENRNIQMNDFSVYLKE